MMAEAEDPRNYVDDIPANSRAQRRALLERMAQEGVREANARRRDSAADDLFEERRSEANYDRGLAVGAPEAGRAELDAERRRLLGGFEQARGTRARGHSREMDRIAAANIAYLKQTAGASVLHKQAMDQMIEAMKLAAAGGGGGGGGGGGYGSSGGSPFTGLVPPGTPPNAAGTDPALAAGGAQSLWDSALRAAQAQGVFSPWGSGGQPPSPAGDGRFDLGPWGFDVPRLPPSITVGPWRFPVPGGSPAPPAGPAPVGAVSMPRPAATAVPGLGAAIAEALRRAGAQ